MIYSDAKEILSSLQEQIEFFNLTQIQETVIYTAIFGDFDVLNEIRSPKSNISYICFTDSKKLTSKTWKIIQCNDANDNPRLYAKIFKVFPHIIFKNAKKSLWVDGNYIIKSNHEKFLKRYDDVKHIKFYRHSLRNCIYDEARIISKEKPEFNPKTIAKQINRYLDDKMPSNQGLINGAIILRNHESILLSKLMEDWWFEIYNYSIRDQISFNYVNWKNGDCVEYFPEEITNFIYFIFKPHLNSNNNNLILNLKLSIKSIIGSIISYGRNK